MIQAEEAIRAARGLIGTAYSELDCINLIKKVIRTARAATSATRRQAQTPCGTATASAADTAI